mgnify:CR=1 FL=1|jgi:hypothetical protein|tara:strand:- start:1702 stop:1980 length:279 start_codon:yes stop_codon:yes gene_type:complete
MGTTYKNKSKAKANKVTNEELAKIQGFVTEINKAQMDVGGLAYQQQMGIQKINSIQSQLNEYNISLQKIYGQVSVNIADGTYKEIPNEPAVN